MLMRTWKHHKLLAEQIDVF